jgi:hypothetical protein
VQPREAMLLARLRSILREQGAHLTGDATVEAVGRAEAAE